MNMLQSLAQSVEIRFGIVGRLFRFLIQNKMWWLVPMFMILVAGFLLILLAQSSPVGPFIYTLF